MKDAAEYFFLLAVALKRGLITFSENGSSITSTTTDDERLFVPTSFFLSEEVDERGFDERFLAVEEALDRLLTLPSLLLAFSFTGVVVLPRATERTGL